jgi:hypothetical protein
LKDTAMTSSAPPASTAAVSIRAWSLLSLAATWNGLLGPAWSFVPAQPATRTPATNLNFAELASFSESTPSTFQTYFNVLAWVLAGAVTVLTIYTNRGHGLVWGLVSALTGTVSLVLTLLALHSLPTPENAWHTMTSIRLGAALTLFGATALVRAGYLAIAGDLRARVITEASAPELRAKAGAE